MTENNTLVLASFGQRVIHFVVDTILIALLFSIIMSIRYGENVSTFDPYNIPPELNYVMLGCLFSYYFVTEYFLGKSIGKLLTKSKVVPLEGEKPNPISILIRSLLRITGIIYIVGSLITMLIYSITLHDLISKTRVIDEKESSN